MLGWRQRVVVPSVEDGLRLSCVSGRKEEGRASGC
jgi:hypothetical protein